MTRAFERTKLRLIHMGYQANVAAEKGDWLKAALLHIEASRAALLLGGGSEITPNALEKRAREVFDVTARPVVLLHRTGRLDCDWCNGILPDKCQLERSLPARACSEHYKEAEDAIGAIVAPSPVLHVWRSTGTRWNVCDLCGISRHDLLTDRSGCPGKNVAP